VSDERATVPLAEDLQLALLFGALGAVAVALLFPYLLATMPQLLAKAKVPLPALVLVQSLQALALLGLLAFAGLRMGHSVGLGSPWLRALRFGRARENQPWLRAIVLGAITALAMLAVSPLFDARMPTPIHPLPITPANDLSLTGFLASFYGGIGEELQLRLFLMTLLVWTFAKLAKRAPSSAVFWSTIAIAALLFGAGHLPAAASIWPLDGVVIARTLVLNGLGGLVFGWLYWKQGFESAMLGHFSADLIIHVAAPLAMGASA
jgi:hypothetical protein